MSTLTSVEPLAFRSSSNTEVGDLSRSQYAYFLCAITMMSGAIRFAGLGVRAPWIDEAYSWAMTKLAWPEFWHAIIHQAADMTVYYALLKIWTVFGDSEFALRSLSAVFSVLTVPIVSEVGRRLYSRKAGILAAAAFAVHVFSIRFAQEARSYALVTFLACLSWLLLSHIASDPSKGRNWFWFSVVSVLEVYSHPIAGLNLTAQLITLIVFSRSKPCWRPMLRSVGAIAVCLGPGALYTVRHRHDLSWIQPTHWSALREFFDEVAGGIGSRVYLAIVAGLFLAVVVRLALVWRAKGRGYEAWAASVPVVGFAFPVLALIVISLRQPTFVGRYVGFVLLPLVWGITQLFSNPKKLPFLLSAVILLGVLLKPLPDYYRTFAFQNYRFQDFPGAVRYIAEHQEPGDGLLAWPAFARPGIEYYGSRLPMFPDYIYPDPGTKFHPGEALVRPDPNTLPSRLAQRDHVWLVISSNGFEYSTPVTLYLKRTLEQSYKLESEQKFWGLVVAEYGQKTQSKKR